jgi:hypothetical protein
MSACFISKTADWIFFKFWITHTHTHTHTHTEAVIRVQFSGFVNDFLPVMNLDFFLPCSLESWVGRYHEPAESNLYPRNLYPRFVLTLSPYLLPSDFLLQFCMPVSCLPIHMLRPPHAWFCWPWYEEFRLWSCSVSIFLRRPASPFLGYKHSPQHIVLKQLWSVWSFAVGAAVLWSCYGLMSATAASVWSVGRLLIAPWGYWLARCNCCRLVTGAGWAWQGLTNAWIYKVASCCRCLRQYISWVRLYAAFCIDQLLLSGLQVSGP